MNDPVASPSIVQHQDRFRRDEQRAALRALLMRPLMTAEHPDFATVRRHADELRAWFARETGWVLHVERECARLYKRPADLADGTRGLPSFERRRYVVFCLVCSVLERADPQITLRVLGERLLALAAEPALAEAGFAFALQAAHERRELVAVCRSLLDLGVLARVAGDEEGFVRDGGASHDALYDVHRRVLAGVLVAVRGPSTWAPEDAPATLSERLAALVAEHVADSEEGRRTAMRHALSRRLLDDPVIYANSLDADTRLYFANQRGAMAARLGEAAGLVAEQRAEGLALVDDSGALSDVAMPAEGTEAHVTLLVAEYLAAALRQPAEDGNADPAMASVTEVAAFVADAGVSFGRYWRKSAREPGAERELARSALERLQSLQLVAWDGQWVRPLPALARFALGDARIRRREGDTVVNAGVSAGETASLFDLR